jgi:hypothetical protein
LVFSNDKLDLSPGHLEGADIIGDAYNPDCKLYKQLPEKKRVNFYTIKFQRS